MYEKAVRPTLTDACILWGTNCPGNIVVESLATVAVDPVRVMQTNALVIILSLNIITADLCN